MQITYYTLGYTGIHGRICHCLPVNSDK